MSTQTLFANENERLTDERLRLVCDEYGARVCPKVRVADTLKVSRHSLSNDLFSYALRAHFDFVIYDPEDLHRPLFAIEFDGESHSRATQIERDEKKNHLCELNQFPLLRINSNWLSQSYHQKDILTYLIERYFLEKSFEEAQEKGIIPEEEGFDPSSLLITQDGKTSHLLWLSEYVEKEYRRLHKKKIIKEHIPSFLIAEDKSNNLRAIGWTMISSSYGILARTGMKHKLFKFGLEDAIEEIIRIETFEALKSSLSGSKPHRSFAHIRKTVSDFVKECASENKSRILIHHAQYFGNPWW